MPQPPARFPAPAHSNPAAHAWIAPAPAGISSADNSNARAPNGPPRTFHPIRELCRAAAWPHQTYVHWQEHHRERPVRGHAEVPSAWLSPKVLPLEADRSSALRGCPANKGRPGASEPSVAPSPDVSAPLRNPSCAAPPARTPFPSSPLAPAPGFQFPAEPLAPNRTPGAGKFRHAPRPSLAALHFHALSRTQTPLPRRCSGLEEHPGRSLRPHRQQKPAPRAYHPPRLNEPKPDF